MRQGRFGTHERTEPNQTRLLGVVVQFVALLVMVGIFTLGHVDDVMLPSAQSAGGDKSDPVVLYLTVNARGEWVVPGRKQPLVSTPEIAASLDQVCKPRDEDGAVKIPVILRCDKDAEYGDVYRLLQETKRAGFTRYRLRALISRDS